MKIISVILILVTLQGTVRADRALRISITPQSFTVEDKLPVSITCRIDDLETTRTTLKIVGVNGKTLATVGKNSGVKKYPVAGLDFEADGHINFEETSYLTVTLKNPQLEDAGTYTCIKEEDTDLGPRESQRATSALKADMIQYLLKKLSILESKLKECCKADGNKADNVTKEHLSKHDEQIALLMGKGSALVTKVGKLEGDITKFGLNIAKTNVKVNKMVAFAVSYTNEHETFKNGDTLKFNRVNLNMGNCYDSNTGYFRAPYPGYFVFNLMITAKKDGDIHVDIRKNGYVMESLRTADKEYFSQASINAILDLDTGDRVYAAIRYTRDGDDLYNGNNGYMYDYFNGYLLKAH